MRLTIALACVIVAIFSAEGADDNAAAEPTGYYIGRGTTKDVSSIIPEFQTGKQWAAANSRLKAGYNRANSLYKKLNAKKYKAQGEKSKELNKKADKALMKLKDAKERIQKKYAKDDPEDFGEGPQTSADKANKKYDAAAKKTESGTWGSSGTPRQLKWYTNGVISSDSYRDAKGHYLLGAARRRIGAGFGRRRRFSTAPVKLTKKVEEKVNKGHDLLKAMGKPTHSSTETDDIIKGMDKHTSAAYKAMRAATKGTKVAKKKLPPGVKEAEKKFIKPADKETLKATGAGEDAEVDKTAHFEPATDVKIIGKEATKDITGGKTAEEMSEAEVTELLQELLG